MGGGAQECISAQVPRGWCAALDRKQRGCVLAIRLCLRGEEEYRARRENTRRASNRRLTDSFSDRNDCAKKKLLRSVARFSPEPDFADPRAAFAIVPDRAAALPTPS